MVSWKFSKKGSKLRSISAGCGSSNKLPEGGCGGAELVENGGSGKGMSSEGDAVKLHGVSAAGKDDSKGMPTGPSTEMTNSKGGGLKLKPKFKGNNVAEEMSNDNDEPLSAQEANTLEVTTASLLYGNNGTNIGSYYKFMGVNPLENRRHENGGIVSPVKPVETAKTKRASMSLGNLLSVSKSDADDGKKTENGQKKSSLLAKSNSDGNLLENVKEKAPLASSSNKDVMMKKETNAMEKPGLPKSKSRRKSFFGLFGSKNSSSSVEEQKPTNELEKANEPTKSIENANTTEFQEEKSSNNAASCPEDPVIQDDSQNVFFARHVANKNKSPKLSILNTKQSPVTPSQERGYDVLGEGDNSNTVASPHSTMSNRRNSLIFERNVQEQPSFSRKNSYLLQTPVLSSRKSNVSLSSSQPKLQRSATFNPSSPTHCTSECNGGPKHLACSRRSSVSNFNSPPGLKAIPNHYRLDDYISPALDSAVNLVSYPEANSPSQEDGKLLHLVNLSNNLSEVNLLSKQSRRPSFIETSLNNYLDKTLSNKNYSSTSLLLKNSGNLSPSLTRRSSNLGSSPFDITDAPPLPNLSNSITGASLQSSPPRRASLYVGVSPYARKKSIGAVSPTSCRPPLSAPEHKANQLFFNTSLSELHKQPSGDRDEPVDFTSYADLVNSESSYYPGSMSYSNLEGSNYSTVGYSSANISISDHHKPEKLRTKEKQEQFFDALNNTDESKTDPKLPLDFSKIKA